MAPRTTSDEKLKTLKPHPEYHHPGGDLRIIIDDTAFQVASIFFTRESPIFRERFEAKGDATDSAKSDKPVKTIMMQAGENVSPDDFAKLCWVFFNKSYSVYEAPLDTWEVILRLANQYQFPEVKEFAFREINVPGKFDMTLVDRIVLYQKYEAESKYLDPLYVELLSRPEPLTLAEAEGLQLASALRISAARECLRAASDRLGASDPLPSSMKDTVLRMAKAIIGNIPLPGTVHPANELGNTSASTSATKAFARPNGSADGSLGALSGLSGAKKSKGKKNGVLGDWGDV